MFVYSVNVPCVQCLDCSSSARNPLNKCKKSGKQTLIQYATGLELTDLGQRITDTVDLKMHSYCRTLFRNEKKIGESNKVPKKLSRLSLEQGFDWKQTCFTAANSV